MKSEIQIRQGEEHITLDKLLKVTGLASSGAEARQFIADGMVKVDGQQELRKTRKLFGGEQVAFDDALIVVKAPLK